MTGSGNPQLRDSTPYELIGGEDAVRRLVERFYDIVEADYPTLRSMLPATTTVSRRKLFEFLSGWMGGPNLYVERYGHPRLRMRHFPFRIDTAAAAQWLEAMDRALLDTGVEGQALMALRNRFVQAAAHLRNTPDEPDPS